MGETKTQGGGGFVPRDRPGIDVCTECGAETTDWWIRGLGCQTCAPDLDYTTARALSPPEDEEHCACTPHLRWYALRLREERATLRAEVARLKHFRDEMCDGFDVPRDTSLEDLDAHISTVLRTTLDTLKERDAEVARLTREVEQLKESDGRNFRRYVQAAQAEERLTRERDEARAAARTLCSADGVYNAGACYEAAQLAKSWGAAPATPPGSPDARDPDDVEQGAARDGPVGRSAPAARGRRQPGPGGSR